MVVFIRLYLLVGIQIKALAPFYRFWGAVVFSLACVSITLSLSVWQFGRAEWKNQIVQSIERNANLPPLMLETQYLTQDFIQKNPYRCIISKGKFDLNSFIYIGPKTNNGRSGYHLYALFYPEVAPNMPIWLLCGWIESHRSNDQILSGYQQTLTFCLELPRAKGVFTPDNIPSKNQWYWPDVKAMSEHLGVGHDNLGKLLASSAPLSPLLAITDKSYLPANRHLEYALTWLALSIILTLLGAIFCMKQWKAIYV